jgi:hypothetical protein
LRQQERQEELSKPVSYQPSREMLFTSLFYDNFLQKLLDHQQEWVSSLMDFATKIALALPDSQLARTFRGELNEQEI